MTYTGNVRRPGQKVHYSRQVSSGGRSGNDIPRITRPQILKLNSTLSMLTDVVRYLQRFDDLAHNIQLNISRCDGAIKHCRAMMVELEKRMNQRPEGKHNWIYNHVVAMTENIKDAFPTIVSQIDNMVGRSMFAHIIKGLEERAEKVKIPAGIGRDDLPDREEDFEAYFELQKVQIRNVLIDDFLPVRLGTID